MPWCILTIGVGVLFFECYYFYRLTDIVSSPNQFDSEAIAITSSIGSIMGGTVGILFSLSSVFFFLQALKSQQNDAKETRALQLQQSFETSLYNLFVIQNDLRNRINNNTEENNHSLVNSGYPTTLSGVANTKMTFDGLFKALENDYRFFLNDSENGILATYIVENNGQWATFEDFFNSTYNMRYLKVLLPEEVKGEIYKRFLGEFRSIVGHYFRHLYHILKFVFDKEREDISLNPKDKTGIHARYKRYVDILQAQMSTYELALCFYNGLIFKRAKFLYQYYDFLENVNKEELLDETDTEFYKNPIKINDVIASGIEFKSKNDW